MLVLPSPPPCRPTAGGPPPDVKMNRQLLVLYSKGKCWMLNVESECWNVECWRLKHNISTFQHRETVNISMLSTFEVSRIAEQHSTLKKNEMLTTLSTFVQIYTTLNVEDLNMLKCWKCWKVERLKCWGWNVGFYTINLNISTFQPWNFSTFQHFNFSTFQHCNIQHFQHFNVEGSKSNSQSNIITDLPE